MSAFDWREQLCPTCGPAPTRTLGLRGGRYHRYGHGEEATIVQCQRCSLLFPNPFPVPKAPNEIYGDPAKYFAAHDEAAKIMRFRALVSEIKTRTGKDDPSLLDVGSGRGELIAAAKRESLSDIVGLETTGVMIEHVLGVHGFTLTRATIEELAGSTSRHFDAITLSAVLEHVHDPNAMIAAAAALTAPGSVLYIDVPNEPSLLTRSAAVLNRLRGSRAVLNLSPTFAPFHVFGFNPRALNALLAKHDFVIERLIVQAGAEVVARESWRDRAQAFVATQINRLGNVTGTAANLYAWARRR